MITLFNYLNFNYQVLTYRIPINITVYGVEQTVKRLQLLVTKNGRSSNIKMMFHTHQTDRPTG